LKIKKINDDIINKNQDNSKLNQIIEIINCDISKIKVELDNQKECQISLKQEIVKTKNISDFEIILEDKNIKNNNIISFINKEIKNQNIKKNKNKKNKKNK